MGSLVNGVWHDEGSDATTTNGRYVRSDSQFRNWVTADGASGFPAEAGRYHLYIAISCPWAHRTWIFRQLKRLDDVISMSIVTPRRTGQGWVFDNDNPRYRDTLLGKRYLHEIYTVAQPDCTGRVTVPVLWDKKRRTIVNNESSEIIRMLNSAFTAFTTDTTDYYPEPLRTEIDALNDLIYRTVNNGVYRTGFATTQEAYEEAVDALFATLDQLEARLAARRYLLGQRLTEADWRLFPTLARFDAAYHGAFKCNVRRLVDYPNLWAYTRELYQMPGIAETVDLEIYKQGYYSPSPLRNPLGIVPKGPVIDFTVPHGRSTL
ncbi:MAG TPA: glutathione S-transferase family protein [Candidatus Binatia bacterium]|jgi:putative glutathione S-transferase|nr:glutathione S-transferase family protein [Candidatus Binatia bacterium]